MSHPKIQHYVPQFLLKGFTRGKKGQLYVYDKSKDICFRTKPHQIAAEKAFYDFEIEDNKYTIEPGLSEIEYKAAIIINKIIERQTLADITLEERIILSVFIAIQSVRVKNFREKLENINSQLGDWLLKFGADLSKVKNYKHYTEDEIKEMSISMLGDVSQNIAPHIMSKGWVLLKNNMRIPFIISDNPVVLDNRNDYGIYGNLGFAVKGIEVYFPLSETLCLYLICPSYVEKIINLYSKSIRIKFNKLFGLKTKNKKLQNLEKMYLSLRDGVIKETEPENIVRQNALQILYASRFIFSPIEEFSLAKEMISKDERYKTGPLFKMT